MSKRAYPEKILSLAGLLPPLTRRLILERARSSSGSGGTRA